MNKIYPKRSAALEAAERRAMLERKKKSEEKAKAAGHPLFMEFPLSGGELAVCVGAKFFKVTDLLLVLDRLVDGEYTKAGESVHSALRRMNQKFLETRELPKGG